ncbi:hypothetical protein [Streptomyces galilaeus]|uniref:Uncharacterized protein n=1 Tax=Streptomyces galilaeus TaxID=33899 RepID=A0ABW9ITJ5_STRGJ
MDEDFVEVVLPARERVRLLNVEHRRHRHFDERDHAVRRPLARPLRQQRPGQPVPLVAAVDVRHLHDRQQLPDLPPGQAVSGVAEHTATAVTTVVGQGS